MKTLATIALVALISACSGGGNGGKKDIESIEPGSQFLGFFTFNECANYLIEQIEDRGTYDETYTYLDLDYASQVEEFWWWEQGFAVEIALSIYRDSCAIYEYRFDMSMFKNHD